MNDENTSRLRRFLNRLSGNIILDDGGNEAVWLYCEEDRSYTDTDEMTGGPALPGSHHRNRNSGRGNRH